MTGPRVRKDIEKLTPEEQDLLIVAWHHICYELEPTDPNSFYQIAGYHGLPFRGAGWNNASWWGGYCNHGNIMFPTWHRAYLLRLEDALRTAPDCGNVTMPFWNETKKEVWEGREGEDAEDKTGYTGTIPPIFLAREYNFQVLRRGPIPNPLFSYKLGKRLVDNASGEDYNYSKDRDYQTVRYPFSGLVGTDADRKKTEVHNKVLSDKGDEFTNGVLNKNIADWLNMKTFNNHLGKPVNAGVGWLFEQCLKAPNYTVFSNTTSAKAWNDDLMVEDEFTRIVPLENPHNRMHLAIGGYETPKGTINQYPDANGDMGENDTASFDPIFFFHHCFIDYVFWQWQQRHDSTEELEIIDKYPGTNSVDSQGPTPGVPGNTWLTLDSPLDPFTKKNPETGKDEPYTSKDMVNIVKLGYDYADVSTDDGRWGKKTVPKAPVLRVSGANRAAIGGSFLISTWVKDKEGEDRLLGVEAVLSRWRVSGCANCQTHLDAGAHVTLDGFSTEEAKSKKDDFSVKVHTRNNPAGDQGEAVGKLKWDISG